MRQLKLRMADETIRSVMVDENQPVANLMVVICTKLGITNHDEYSLIACGRRRERPPEGRIIDQKMEQLKKKLKTDEDLAWVDHSKTLDEQEIHEQDVVLLRRRFFYSDHNIDSRDPIQLGLLYVQTRDAILSGTHPVTLDGACRFAGIQCQAQLGDFVEGKTTRPNYLNLKEYLPGEYAKQKHIERKVFAEHKRYYGLGELEAKAKYVSEARSLPTYGVTFFLVKEKVAGKNKLVPRLLGITKDCVMRVDADTKGILKTWPLTTVKRWAPSMNSFTLDFGDYSDSFYSVQTTEGEQISQLIAGYIDIILKRRKAKDHFGIEGDEGATMVEDSVAPSRATIIQNTPKTTLSRAPSQTEVQQPPPPNASLGPTVERQKLERGPVLEPSDFRPAVEVRGRAEIGYEARPATQYVTNYELSLPQRDLQDRLELAQEAVEEAQQVLDRPQGASASSVDRMRYGGESGSGREEEQRTLKRRLSNQFAEINAATAQLVSLSAIPEEELNYPALNTAVETVAQSLPGLAAEVKQVASLMDDEECGERLIDAARRLCKAFSDLLNAAEPGPTVPRQSLISAASRVGDATQALLYTINQSGDDEAEQREREHADELLALAKAVASSAAALVLKAKDVTSTCQGDQALENLVIGSATQCALATSQMVATAKIVAPTIQDPACQRKLLDSCREVQRAVEGIRSACERAIRDERLRCEVNESVHRVNEALDDLMDHVKSIKRQQQQHQVPVTRTHHGQQQQQSTTNNHSSSTNITTTVHQIIDESSGWPVTRGAPAAAEDQDPAKSELVNQARTLARATAQLIQDIRPEGQQPQQQQHQHQQERYIQPQQQSRPQSVYDTEYSLGRNSFNQTETATKSVHEERRTIHNQNQPDHSNSQSYTHEHQYQHHEPSQQQQQPEPSVESPEMAISGIVGDLETSIMFATAGTLRAQDDHDGYLYYRENVLRCAKALVEDTRPLVASAASDERQLAQAAQESVFTMVRLADTVKSSAASLGPSNSESQVSLIRSVRDVANSLADLIGATRLALGCDPNYPRLGQVKSSAKTMVTSVTSLLKTVKSVEDEQQRGCRALESALEAIEQELVNYEVQCGHEDAQERAQRCQPDELARITRPVTMATVKTVHAASSGLQDDAIVAANMGRKAVVDMLRAARSASFNAPAADSFELRMRVQDAGKSCAHEYKHLMELLHRIFQHPSIASANPEIKQELISQSKRLANCVHELETCSELLRQRMSTMDQSSGSNHQLLGENSASSAQQQTVTKTITTKTTTTSSAAAALGGDTGSNWMDPDDDPTVIAESELLGAASSIDAAAKKLENLKPRVSSVKLPHEDLNFDEIILDAAKSIIEATAALLRAASASQRELLVDGRLDETETFYASDNNQWSEGLVSAARMVAAATHSLVEAANELVQGQASEERLISAAKQVASSTNQLLVACKVKADPDSRTMSRLANAGNQVKRATDNLVRAAQQAIEHDEEQSLIISNRKVSGIAQEISAREQILRKEKELEVAKTQLMAIRKAKYANRPDDYQGYGGSLD